jgi:phospholipase C
MTNKLKTTLLSTVAVLAVMATVASIRPVAADQDDKSVNPNNLKTATPIKHLVVIFNENRSFDHYFGTYPNALNVEGEPRFEPAAKTPMVNNLLSSPTLLDNNPNLSPANGTGATNPFRLDRTQANTADQNHAYSAEQKAFDLGALDLFPLNTGSGTTGGGGAFGTKGQVMGFFDGNTVTALWNYAQNFAMNDNSWSDTFGPSTPGLLNMFAAQTNGIVPTNNGGAKQSGNVLADGTGITTSGFTLIGDIDPTMDVCSTATLPGRSGTTVASTAKNIGDLLNAADIPWGSFVGGFNLQTINENGSSGCKGVNSQGMPASNAGRSSVSTVIGAPINDYVQHHIWFQYFKSTANPMHLRPTSTKAIGFTTVPGTKTVDPANHAYDLNDFTTAVGSGNFPAVSFIKMPAFQDEHPGNSDPLDAQTGIVNLVNFLMQQPDWESTAVILAYDDSDGWYDHAFIRPTNMVSFSGSDFLNGTGNCGTPGQTEPTGVNGLPVAGRCGPGMRQPFMVISPFAKKNFVDHTFTTQASIPRFIEDNWLNGERLGNGASDATTGSIMNMFDFKQKKSVTLFLDPTTGLVDETKKIKKN